MNKTWENKPKPVVVNVDQIIMMVPRQGGTIITLSTKEKIEVEHEFDFIVQKIRTLWGLG